MTNIEFTEILMNLTITSMILIEKYPKEENLINSFLDKVESDESLIKYIINLIAFSEAKEEFEICADLLKAKTKIK